MKLATDDVLLEEILKILLGVGGGGDIPISRDICCPCTTYGAI